MGKAKRVSDEQGRILVQVFRLGLSLRLGRTRTDWYWGMGSRESSMQLTNMVLETAIITR